MAQDEKRKQPRELNQQIIMQCETQERTRAEFQLPKARLKEGRDKLLELRAMRDQLKAATPTG